MRDTMEITVEDFHEELRHAFYQGILAAPKVAAIYGCEITPELDYYDLWERGLLEVPENEL